jgi:DNA (cytosine-5)-methyltransferase 1
LSLGLPGGVEVVTRDGRDGRWLREEPVSPTSTGTLRVVDLFCGCGGMSLGLKEAARRAHLDLDVRLAVDTERYALDVYEANLGGARTREDDASALFQGMVGDPITRTEATLRSDAGPVHALVGGPPCQGHSDLNNRTRRRDPKNALYSRMARAAEVFMPDVVVIENVPPVQWDSENVVELTVNALEKLEYRVDTRVLHLVKLGVPQTRRRFLLLAAKNGLFDAAEVLDRVEGVEFELRDVRWAIDDLRKVERTLEIDKVSRMSTDNKRRVQHLFKKGRYNLPNEERPPCHRDKDHTYNAVYGRLRWNKPAPTITTGFTSMGQGRYVHPTQQRTLTPHEAARLQTFPDWFDWGESRRTDLSTMIGNAVPPLMMVRLGEFILPPLDV